MKRTLTVLTALLLALPTVGVPSARAEQPNDFDRAVKPLLAKHCIACHGSEKQRGDIRLDGPAPDLVNPKVRATWEKVHSMLVRGEMPPSEKPKLTTDELNTLTTWIRQGVERGVLADRGGAGRTTMRRLTRVEYARMLEDVLGLHFSNVPTHLWEKLPNDPQTEAPLNDGDLLTFQSLHLKSYVDLTERAVSAVLAPEARPTPFTYRIDPRSVTHRGYVAGLGNGEKGFSGKVAAEQTDMKRPATVNFGVTERNADGTFSLPPIYRMDPGYLGRDKMNAGSCYLQLPLFPKSGVLHIRIRAGAVIPQGEGAPVMRVILYNNVDNERFGRQIATIPVTNPPDKLRDYEVEIPLDLVDYPWPLFERSKHVSLRITNDYMPISDRELPKREKNTPLVWPWQEPMLVLDQIEVNGPGTLAWPQRRHQALLAAGDKLTDEKERASAILTEVASRAWRRPVTAAEIAPFVKLYQDRRQAGESRDAAFLQPLTGVLVSPFAIYIVERKAEKVAPLTDLELANRLSTFLWGRGPDKELLDLAVADKLRDPRHLAEQVERLLDDPRSAVFAEDFVRRLLALERVENDPIDFAPTLRTFDAGVTALREVRLKHDLAREPVRYFEHVLKQNRSLHELVGSDYILVNDRLANYYGIADVTGSEFRTVPAPTDRTRGWLTMAGVLAAASRGNKEATIHRGVYLLQRFLGEHPGTPPGNVESLEVQAKADGKRAKLTIREQVKLHTSINTCQLCHRKIDPLGFVWADFNHLGKNIAAAQPKTPATAIDCSGQFPDGRKFSDLESFAALLKDAAAKSRYQFGEVLLRQLAGYALARPLNLHDEAELRELVRSAQRDGWRLREVIKAIVVSKSFTHG